MKILLVYPMYPKTFWSFSYALKFISKKASLPPLGLLTVAAMLPKDWEVRLVDKNVRRLKDADLQWADYVFLSAMSIQKESALSVIDRCKAAGVKVIAGGPLFTANPEEFGLVDHLVLNEAEITLPLFLEGLKKGTARRVYTSPQWADISSTPTPRFDLLDLKAYASMSIQYSRGCPFNCEFCDITLLCGRTPRTKEKEQIIRELESVYAYGFRGQVFFVDDNFAINPRRAKSLMRAMIEADVRIYWVAQISMNLLRDQELLDLLKASGCVCVFIGLESVLPESLKEVSKTFNKPEEYGQIIGQLQRRGVYCVTAFIMGIDADRTGVARKTWDVAQNWPPGFFPVFSQLTPLPGTPLYKSLREQGRLEERHWLNYRPYGAAFTPRHMTPAELENEVRTAWGMAYSPSGIFRRIRRMRDMRFVSKLIYLFATLAFRGIYFRQMTVRAWLKLIWQNRRSVREVFSLRSFTNHEIAPLAASSSPQVQNASPSTATPGS